MTWIRWQGPVYQSRCRLMITIDDSVSSKYTHVINNKMTKSLIEVLLLFLMGLLPISAHEWSLTPSERQRHVNGQMLCHRFIILVQYYGERELVPASYCFSVAVKSAHFLIAIFYRSSSSSSFKKAVVSDHIDNDDIQQWIVFQGVIQIAYNSTIATKAHELMHISLSSLINYEIRPIGLRLSQDFGSTKSQHHSNNPGESSPGRQVGFMPPDSPCSHRSRLV